MTTADPGSGELHHRLPHLVPDGDAVLFTVQTFADGWDDTRVVVRSLASGEQKTVVENAADARYVRDGYLVYARMGTLFAQRFDLARREVTGPAVAVADDVMQDVNSRFAIGNSGAAQFSVSATGELAYLPGGVSPAGSYIPVWVDRNGATEDIRVPRRALVSRPRVSPDGTRIAFQTGNALGIFDIARGIYHELTPPELSGPALSVLLRVMAWHPDGERIAFTGRDGNLFWIPADGSSGAEPLTDPAEQSASVRRVQLANSWSPDGSTLAFIQREETADGSSSDIWLLSFAEGRPAGARPFRNTPADEVAVEFSPDGRHLAYQVSEGRQAEVYAEPYPGPGRRDAISSDRGLQPLWRRDGRQLFYLGRTGDRISMMAVDVTPGERFAAGRPRELWNAMAVQYPTGPRGRAYDIMPDGQRFVMIQQRDDFSQPPITHIHLVQHWAEDLKRLLPAP